MDEQQLRGFIDVRAEQVLENAPRNMAVAINYQRSLQKNVLHYIADNDFGVASELAKLALSTEEIEFERRST